MSLYVAICCFHCYFKWFLFQKEDPPELLRKKCSILAEAIKYAKHMVVYTGAGISTVSWSSLDCFISGYALLLT